MKLRLKSRLRLLSHGMHYLSMQAYLSIDGWLTVDEAVTLHDLARAVPPGGHAVEIGSWQGKSAVVIGKGLPRGATLHCVDPFNADGCPPSLPIFQAHRARHRRSLREGFEHNVRRNGVAERIRVWHGYSHEMAPCVQEELDLLFIDGNHDYEAVRADFELWAPKLRVGGAICLHDACDKFPGVQRLIEEELTDAETFGEGRLVDSLFVARRIAAPVPV